MMPYVSSLLKKISISFSPQNTENGVQKTTFLSLPFCVIPRDLRASAFRRKLFCLRLESVIKQLHGSLNDSFTIVRAGLNFSFLQIEFQIGPRAGKSCENLIIRS